MRIPKMKKYQFTKGTKAKSGCGASRRRRSSSTDSRQAEINEESCTGNRNNNAENTLRK